MGIPGVPASVGPHRAAWLCVPGWIMWVQAPFVAGLVAEEKAKQHKGRGCALPA